MCNRGIIGLMLSVKMSFDCAKKGAVAGQEHSSNRSSSGESVLECNKRHLVPNSILPFKCLSSLKYPSGQLQARVLQKPV